ncbi:uncharacterized protein LAJ45_04828 [Morchella importuna]|uniref:uncharacterized protein n=1 Tax=Morchella importuna TaxID=1174673 RepID=UPI001E8E025A|nr:uncharacterized protein LAJ45_04828 [Morchella importuna]KAH8151126.1 hypothetical protein LAJ45_04828 [Morchella importuna]
MAQEADRNAEDARWMMADLAHVKLQLAKAHEQLTSLRAEVEQLRLLRPPGTPTAGTIKEVPNKSKQTRTRIGIYTPAELTVLGEAALTKLDQHVLELSVQVHNDDAFESAFREAGAARVRPHYYEMSEAEAGVLFNDTGLSAGERCYWGMVQAANSVVEMGWYYGNCMNRVMYSITMMDYLDWRGIAGETGGGQ